MLSLNPLKRCHLAYGFFFFFNSKFKKKKPSIQDPVDPTAEKVGVEVDNDRVVVDNVEGGGGSDLMVEMGQTKVVESWVTVESVADTCIRRFEQWVNEAYKRMVMKELEYCDG